MSNPKEPLTIAQLQKEWDEILAVGSKLPSPAEHVLLLSTFAIRIIQRIHDGLIDELLNRMLSTVMTVMMDHESLGLVNSRLALDEVLGQLSLPSWNRPALIHSLEVMIQSLEPASIVFEDQIAQLCELLANCFEEAEDWLSAAKILLSIPLESTNRPSFSPLRKLQHYIRITRLYLEEGDSVTAEIYLNRASTFLLDDTALVEELQIKSCQAKIMERKHQYLPASSKYYELSNMSTISPADRMSCLSTSIICALLSGAGPQRSRMLATLYLDPRVQENTPIPELDRGNLRIVLEKVYMNQILQTNTINEFANILEPHHLAILAGGVTALVQSVREHNVLSASKLYSDIVFEALSDILGISDVDRAVEVVAKMISEGRLLGTIDQMKRVIKFQSSSTTDKSATFCRKVQRVAVLIAHE